MTKDAIIALPNPLLRQKSKRVGFIDDEIKQLADDMISATTDWEESRAHEFGAALAAVQIGQLHRVAIIRDDFDDKNNKNFSVLINPEIIKTYGTPVEEMEGCLSVSDIYGSVGRFPKIKVKALNLEGREVRITATGFLARVLQHEIDHMDGLVFTDRVEDTNKLFKIEKSGRFTPLSPSAHNHAD